MSRYANDPRVRLSGEGAPRDVAALVYLDQAADDYSYIVLEKSGGFVTMRAVYTDPDGRQESKMFATVDEAICALIGDPA